MTGDNNENGRLCHSLPPTVLNHLQSVVGHEAVINSTVRKAKSAQQQVFVVSLDPTLVVCPPNLSCKWRDALERGRHNVVVRLWIGSARWWNLHCCELNYRKDDENGRDTDGVLTLARAEVAGYRIARTAFLTTTTTKTELPLLEIPQVLYFSHDSKVVCNNNAKKQPPWALLSYVGFQSAFFHDNSSQITPTEEWLDGMIPIRREFGFDEPHPRWGRVPVDQCLTFCFHILERFILPMHSFFLSNEEKASGLDWTELGRHKSADGKVHPWTYKDMIALYERAHSRMVPKNDAQTKIVDVLGQCIQRLGEAHITDMPPVLCHMDCQPQNLIFFRQQGHHNPSPQLHSALDWEEAAYADPRFELTCMCRKVCANRDQAQAVWDYYSDKIQQHTNPTLVVGAMDAWLQLETVHSLTTLVLQSMNLLGGGRNPWEQKTDLMGKMEREFHRLKGQGWTFCEGAITR